MTPENVDFCSTIPHLGKRLLHLGLPIQIQGLMLDFIAKICEVDPPLSSPLHRSVPVSKLLPSHSLLPNTQVDLNFHPIPIQNA